MDDLADLRARFKWTADKADGWRVLRNEVGPLKGDCDDFAITALWLTAGRSWARVWWMLLTFQAVIWFCQTNSGGGHVMLWVRGKGWIDNIYPTWGPKPRHTRRFPHIITVIMIKLAVGRFQTAG